MLDWIEHNIPAWVYITFVVHLVVLGSVAYMILLERKVASWVQDRIGPNRVGLGFGIIPFLKDKKMMGLGQPLADGLKFIVKEDYRPKHVDGILFTLAPIVMIIVVIISIAVIPWGGWKRGTKQVDVTGLAEPALTQKVRDQLPAGVEVTGLQIASPADAPGKDVAAVTYRWPFQIANLNIGVVFVLATLSLAVYGVVVGGWASNNKYSFLGGLRATANMISYEIPLGLAVLAIVVMYGTLNLDTLVTAQARYWYGVIPAWNVFTQPLGFVLFLICIHAEANRAPFDTAEAEQELVGGYHTEYSSMRFALFFLAEYAGMVTTSAVCVALFFGGWHLPWLDYLWPALQGKIEPHPQNGVINETWNIFANVIRSFVFFGKTMAIIFVFMWVRWSLPRFRFDQIMMLAWRAMIPISLALLMVTATVVYLCRGFDRPLPQLIGLPEGLVYLIANVVVFAAAVALSLVVPAAPATNRKVNIPNSRYRRTPLPGRRVGAPKLDTAAARSVAVEPVPDVAGRMGN